MNPHTAAQSRRRVRGPFRQHATPRRSHQRGATLIVAVIVLMLITMTVISAFRISRSHAQAVANMQFKDEALAAAHIVLEDVISLPNVETLVLADGTIALRHVDINRDGTDDLQIALSAPLCVRVEPSGSSGEEIFSDTDSPSAESPMYVLWEVQADVTDPTTGAHVSVVQGYRQQVSAIPDSCN